MKVTLHCSVTAMQRAGESHASRISSDSSVAARSAVLLHESCVTKLRRLAARGSRLVLGSVQSLSGLCCPNLSPSLSRIHLSAFFSTILHSNEVRASSELQFIRIAGLDHPPHAALHFQPNFVETHRRDAYLKTIPAPHLPLSPPPSKLRSHPHLSFLCY